jgi:hypothetical protein
VPDYDQNLEKSKLTWDHMDVNAGRSVAWLSIPLIDESIKNQFKGAQGPLHTCHELLNYRGLSHGLSGAALVCGDMESERVFFETTSSVSFKEVDGFDLSDISLNRVRPTSYIFNSHVTDCNQIVLESQKYDFVIASHGAHHIFALDNLFEQINESLNTNGLFYMYEWIGPRYLQIPLANSFVARLLLVLFFPLKRTRTTHMGKVRGFRYLQDTPESFDPSEACNSDELYGIYRKHLNLVHEYKHGGLCYPMFEGLAQNMDLSRNTTLIRIRFVIKIESILTKLRLIKPLFTCSIAQKRT